MILKDLDSFLRKETDSEKWHKKNPDKPSEVYNRLPVVERNNKKLYLFDFTEDMDLDDIIIFKETRYTKLYAHSHKYLELNYVYSGSCEFEINGVQGVLNQGDICILEPDVVHSAEPKGKYDIVINIALKNKYYCGDFLSHINEQGIISKFLMDCFSETRMRDYFLVFRNSKTMLSLVMNSILYLYFFNRMEIGYYTLMGEYIKLILIHLANSAYDSAWSYYHNKNDDTLIFEIIKYIHEHYSKCELKDLAEEYKYNYNYICNLIKKKTGHTFSELKLEQQLIAAKELLLYSRLSISEICFRCGLTNQSFFYRKFFEFFKCSPNEFRKINQ